MTRLQKERLFCRIELLKRRTVFAQYGNTQSTRTYFVYDDVLVRIIPEPDFPSDWTKDLSFEKIYLND